MACILLWSSAVRVHDSQACTKMDVTREHISRILELRNTPVIPNWFQLCQCCCCLCYPRECLRLGTLISYNWAQVLEACDCLKRLSTYFDLCVDASSSSFLLSHRCHQQSGDWWLLFCLQCWQCLHDLLRPLSWSSPEICWRGLVRVDITVKIPTVVRNQSPTLLFKRKALVALL